MKKKNKKNSIEKALEVVTTLKSNVEIFQKNGQDIEFIKTLDVSVRKIVKLEKEISILKEKLTSKKSVFDLEKESTLELVKNAKKILKKELGENPKPDNKDKPKENEIAVTIEDTK